MRYAEITIMVELSEEITGKEREGALMDDINDTLVNLSDFVTALRSIEIKDVTALVESADKIKGRQ